ncbi:MAG: hypothetical protein ACREPR_02930 [Brasilonema sp.]
MSKTNFSADMSPEERHKKLVEMPDEASDYSDIAPLDEDFWKNSVLTSYVEHQQKLGKKRQGVNVLRLCGEP